MLKDNEFEKLIHNIKRASKAVALLKTESNKDKREIIASLLEDELNRMYEDLEELRKNGKKRIGG